MGIEEKREREGKEEGWIDAIVVLPNLSYSQGLVATRYLESKHSEAASDRVGAISISGA